MSKIIPLLLISIALSGCSFPFTQSKYQKEREEYRCECYSKIYCRKLPAHTKKLIEATPLDLVSCSRCVESEYKRCLEISSKEYYNIEKVWIEPFEKKNLGK